ncbi:MAG: pyrrolo-quinoline quinone [Clostridia bacterium]|nr:pyrrolo-quinoline quinone [Clostridia bacterium]
MKKRISLLILFLTVVLILNGCTYLKDRLINGEPLYGGGQVKNNANIVVKSDIGLYPYSENFKTVSTIDIAATSLPSYYDKYNFAIFDENGQQFKKISGNTIFGSSQNYSEINGVTTFKGNNFRNSSSFGYPVIESKSLNLIWQFETSHIDEYKGIGWTGQPAIVQWPAETQNIMNMYHSYKTSSGTVEVIYGALDGNIYFVDLYTGKYTRDPISLGLPIFGSITVDPRGYPLLYVGTGFNMNGLRYEDMTFSIISLIDGSVLYQINGSDSYAIRTWGAFDSSPLIDKVNDCLFIGCENGLLYSLKLNSDFSPENKSISVAPELTRFYYVNPFGRNAGFESSLAAFKNYIYITDNGGLLQCLNAQTLEPVWIYDLKDDSDSTVSIEVVDSNTVYLYTATEVSFEKESSFSYIRKFNALTGDMIWESKFKCFYSESMTTGTTSTPVIGLSEISDSVIYSVTGLGENGAFSNLISFDKSNGNIIWKNENLPYSLSSPVELYDENGKAYIIMSYSNGLIELINGQTGVPISNITIQGSIEGSPAIYNGNMVIGTRSGNIYSIKIN